MKRYDITVGYITTSGDPAAFTIDGYYAESAWSAVMNVMTKPSVACIREDRLIRIDVSRVKPR